MKGSSKARLRKADRTIPGLLRHLVRQQVSVETKSGSVLKGVLGEITTRGNVTLITSDTDSSFIRGDKIKYIIFEGPDVNLSRQIAIGAEREQVNAKRGERNKFKKGTKKKAPKSTGDNSDSDSD